MSTLFYMRHGYYGEERGLRGLHLELELANEVGDGDARSDDFSAYVASACIQPLLELYLQPWTAVFASKL